MRLKFYLILILLGATAPGFSNYVSPGSGVRFTLNDLVTQSNGDVTFESDVYTVRDTIFISQNDTLQILSNALVKFTVATYLDVNGTLIINPPTEVRFTAENTTTGFYGVRVDSSNSTVIRKLTLEYANSLRLFDSNIIIDSCNFRNNTPLTTFGNAAISLFRSNPLITNCQFLNNQRAAIQGGANINNAPVVIGCLFMGNNTLNTNVPQINLGATSSGSDTLKIINNRFLRASTNSGAIAFLPVGNLYAVISGNIIKNNRYGISLQGGSNINARISYNVIDSNNTQNDPILGGSGISFSGGSATSHQNTIVTGNLIRWNLWGITIQGGSKPNLGNLSNSDTSDNGKNEFIGNNNASTPGVDVYNNSPDSILAQNNYWGTNDTVLVESRIYHNPDNPALGFVNYLPYTVRSPLPVIILSFQAQNKGNDIVLDWRTPAENNTSDFIIQRSSDGRNFANIGLVRPSVNAGSATDYTFNDNQVTAPINYYRLQLKDVDGRFSYSNVLRLAKNTNGNATIKVYPTVITGTQIQAEVNVAQTQKISIQFLTLSGQLFSTIVFPVKQGRSVITIPVPADVIDGAFVAMFTGVDFYKTELLIRK